MQRKLALAEAVLTLETSVLNSQRAPLVEIAAKSRLPVMYVIREGVELGGLMSYGVSTSDLFRRAAVYVDKILKDAKPGDLPVEQPTKFDFVINLKTAQGDRSHHPAECAGASGQGYSMRWE